MANSFAPLRSFLAFATLFVVHSAFAGTADIKPIHDRFAPEADIERIFNAFTVSFDSKDDDTGDGKSDLLRVPHWVSQEIRHWKTPSHQQNGGQAWCFEKSKNLVLVTDKLLFNSGVAPNKASYLNSGYKTAHLAKNILIKSIDKAPVHTSLTLLNAIPQEARFNSGIWQNLEDLTTVWAQEYEKIWVMQGPVFMGPTVRWIGDETEHKVAVPDAVYKIIVRQEKILTENKTERDDLDVLAFLYPQSGPGYYGNPKNYQHARFLTSVDEIEELTGLDFFIDLGRKPIPKTKESAMEKRLERTTASELWYPTKINTKNKGEFPEECPS